MKTGLRVGVAQINTVLGDFKGNADKVLEVLARAEQRFCDLVLFPEATLFGYHPFDMLERADLVEKQLRELARVQKGLPQNVACILGVITKNKNKKGRPYFNSAAFLQKNKPAQFFHKQLLPTGDVFDEARFIESGKMENNFFTFKGKRLFLTICEDIWAWPDKSGHSLYEENPLEKLKSNKVDLVLNLSASPFYPGKKEVRRSLAAATAKKLKAPVIYCNLVGAQDEIIFDGGSFAVDKNGKVLLQNVFFEEDFNVFDLAKQQGGLHPTHESAIEEIRSALVLGIRDFCAKAGLKRVHLGLSGGIDSALVACLAVDALGLNAVNLIYLPTEFNASESAELGQQIAKNLGVRLIDAPIQGVFESFRKQIDAVFSVEKFGLVHENLQSRIRGTFLMAYSNLHNSLLLMTGNKSEIAAGYSTLYGDSCGGLAPIGDLTKAQVVKLSRLYNSDEEIIPERVITRPPSAELRPNQTDQDSLPPYEDLDKSVVKLVEKLGQATSATDKWLLEKMYSMEFKRWQAPPILKVSKHSFGRGRRWPVAHRAR